MIRLGGWTGDDPRSCQSPDLIRQNLRDADLAAANVRLAATRILLATSVEFMHGDVARRRSDETGWQEHRADDLG